MFKIAVENVPERLQIPAFPYSESIAQGLANATASRFNELQPMVSDKGRRDVSDHQLRIANIGKGIEVLFSRQLFVNPWDRLIHDPLEAIVTQISIDAD